MPHKELTKQAKETQSDRVTEGVRVQVESQYLPAHSAPQLRRYAFAYHVTITNESHATPVQLRTRHWIIKDQLGKVEEVRGPGVVGEEPLLAVGESFEYTSGALLETPRGVMEGSYQLERPDGTTLDVVIAPFVLAIPFSLN